MKEKRETVYVKADRNSICHDPKIRIMDVMSVQCSDPAICAGIKNKTLYHFQEKEGGKNKKRIEVFSILNVIELIQADYPEVEVVSYGEQDFVVEYVKIPLAPKWWEITKVVLLCVLIFLGSGFTIMAFNNDVSVGEVFDRFYGQIMGVEKPNVTEVELFYCIGLAVGIIVFFNHIGKKKITSDPTPIQVEMRKYEKDVDTTFIENAGRKGHEHDVG
jgi:stage V sporulation protein AA